MIIEFNYYLQQPTYQTSVFTSSTAEVIFAGAGGQFLVLQYTHFKIGKDSSTVNLTNYTGKNQNVTLIIDS